MLTLFAHPESTYAQKVQFFLEEAAIPYRLEKVDLRKGEQARSSFLRRNPFGKVPTIDHDGFCLGESGAILRYLAQRFARSAWYPENLEDRARVDQYCDFINLHINRYLATLAWNLEWAAQWGVKAKLEGLDDARENLRKNLIKLEQCLQCGPSYLAGPAMTLADATLLPFLAVHDVAGFSLADFPHLRTWLARMQVLASWQKVAEAAKPR